MSSFSTELSYESKPPKESTADSWPRQLYTAVAATVVLTVLCGAIYPMLVWGIAQAVFPVKANGSLVKSDGTYTTQDSEAVGSAWLGQTFTAPQYFHPRPSAAGSGYDATASGGTNLGPTSDKFLNGIHGSKKADLSPDPASDFDGVKDLAAAYRTENGLSPDTAVPQDAVTRSGSGLDPQITPANAAMQAARVAKARGMSDADVRVAIETATQKRDFGLFGEPGVNVLLLNLALDQHHPVPAAVHAK